MAWNNLYSPYSNRQIYKRKMVKKKKSSLLISIKKITREYCSDSSICGLKHLVNDKTPFIERVIWVITLIGALICSVTLVWITFKKYYQAPLVTTQFPEGVPVSTIIFPAVGICTNNRISKMAVTELAQKLLKEERNKDYNEKKMLSLLYGLGQLYTLSQPAQENKTGDSAELHRVLGKYNVNELMKSLTPHCEDILLRCAWNEQPKNCSELLDFRLTANGYCCTFNYLRESDTFEDGNSRSRNIDMYKYGNKSNYDYDQGLKVLLRLNESDDFFYNVALEGAQLQFSDAYDFPDAPSGSFAMQMISPNVEASLSIMNVLVAASFTEASRDIQHVSVKMRQCLFYDESPYLPFYTSSDCMLKCRMLFMLEKCNCTPFNMPKILNTNTCDMSDILCLRTYYAQSISIRPTDVENVPKELELDLVNGGISCPMCYPTCSKTTYNYDFSNVNIYPDQLNSLVEIDDWLQGANFTGTSIIHVKHGKATAECYGLHVIMKWFDLISNIGSTCGFVTGFSFVSLLEFLYFYSIKLIRDIQWRRSQERKRTNVNIEPTEHSMPAHFEPITRYRSIYWNEFASSRFGHNHASIK